MSTEQSEHCNVFVVVGDCAVSADLFEMEI